MKTSRALSYLWIASIVVLTALHFVHLRADFPNYSRWMDWSKYTDEGWYANAAIEYFVRGSWYVPGDFNTGVAVPVWPFLEWILFHLTGVSLLAARSLGVSLFFCNLLLSYKLVRRDEQMWVALLASSLIATNSFLFCFSRLAILEPLLTCLTLVSLLLARTAGAHKSNRGRYALAALMGGVFCLMVLTKTTAIFLLPAILYSLWYPLRRNLKEFVGAAAVMGLVSGALWSGYYFLLVRPRYLIDYRYFFFINVYQKPHTLLGWLTVFYYAMRGSLWVDRTLALTCVALLITTLLFARSVWRNPVFVSSVLALGGYLTFIAYINNMQPRYYAVVAFFLFFTIALASAALLRTQHLLGIAALVIIVLAMTKNTWEMVGFVLYPEYTFVNAAKGVTEYMDKHPNGNRLLVSISGNDISLITGVPSLCDDFGTQDLPDKLARYKPGWYAAWNELDAGILEDLQTRYTLEQAASFKAFDDDDRDTLVLYKLHPLPHATSR